MEKIINKIKESIESYLTRILKIILKDIRMFQIGISIWMNIFSKNCKMDMK